MEPEDQRIDVPAATTKPRKRRWRWGLAVAAVGLVVLVAVLPYLASIGPIRDSLLRAALPKIDGSVHAGSARLGWFSPIRFEQIEIRSPDGERVVSIARLEGDRALWRMIFGSELGTLRIDEPQVDVVLDRNGSNLSRVFIGRERPDVALGVKIVDGRVSIRGGDSARAWTAEPVHLAFRLRPSSASAEGEPRLEIEPGVVFSDAELTLEVCHDLLKYIAPVLADVTEASGRFSLALDRWELPMTDFARGEGSGRLTIHELNVGPGPLVRELATLLKVPPRLAAVENESVTFRMADGRIHHSELSFRLQRLVVRTSGSVGVEDRSLAMVAELAVPEELPGDRPALVEGTLRIPIKGTLSKPEIDGEALVRSLAGSGIEVLGEMMKNGQLDLGELIKAIRQRRQERHNERADPAGQPDTERKRPLRKLIRGVLDQAGKEAGSGP